MAKAEVRDAQVHIVVTSGSGVGARGRFTFEPMREDKSLVQIVEALLKYPGRIIHELQFNWRAGLSTWLLLLALLV